MAKGIKGITGARYMKEEDEGRESGVILLWIGVCIFLAGLLLLVYHAMTCPCNDSVGEEQVACVCGYMDELLIMVAGAVIALVAFLIRSRDRRRSVSHDPEDAD